MTIVKSDPTHSVWSNIKINPANLVTHTRTPLALLGVISGLFGWLTQAPWLIELGLLLLVISALTDTIDGSIARRLGCVSDFGALLDTTQDKIFLVIVVSSSLVPLSCSDPTHACLLVIWLIVNVWRDYCVMMLRLIGSQKGLSGQAQWFGKLRTISLMVFGCFLYAFAFNSGLNQFIPYSYARLICLVTEGLIATITIATWIAYAKFYGS